MKVFTLQRTQTVPASLDEVFGFFRLPENLARVTPAWLNFRILTPSPIEMRVGTLIDYTIGWLGLTMRWTTLITAYDPPHRFVDEQLKGPYSFWHHTHTFFEKDGVTAMTDTVRYALPFGVVGALAHALVVRRQVEHIFEYRTKIIAQEFENDDTGKTSRALDSNGSQEGTK
jgi:ligand-binding SRPBCC domain-containing protein